MFWRTVVRDSDDNTRITDEGPWAKVAEMNAEAIRVLSTGASWSGHERNHLFFGGLPGHQFARLSGVSGLDDPGDSRAFATIDYDRDGWLDIVLANVSAPRTRLLRNEIGERESAADNRFVAIRFVGGNTQPEPSREWSSRDGLGCRVELDLGATGKIYREHRLDDGFKAQNTATMLIGIGRAGSVDTVSVRWLSGRTQVASSVAAGTLLTVYEDVSASPTGEAFVREPYRAKRPDGAHGSPGSSEWKQRLLPREPSTNTVVLGDEPVRSELVLYLGMATWCAACVTEIPELRVLRAALGPDELAMIGVPFDKSDPPAKLNRWVKRYTPPYELAELSEAELTDFTNVVKSELWQTERLPLSIVTDASGRVLLARWGVPTLSELRALQWRFSSR